MRTFRVFVVTLAAAVLVGGGLLVSNKADGSDDDGGPLSVEDIIRLEGTESQAGYLADGDITAEEREAAFWDWVGCMESQGVEVIGYVLDPRGGEEVDVVSQLDADAENDIVFACRAEHMTAVSVVYQMLHGPTEAELADEAERVADCMRDSGIEVPEGLTLIELMHFDSQAGYCYHDVRQYTGTP